MFMEITGAFTTVNYETLNMELIFPFNSKANAVFVVIFAFCDVTKLHINS